MGSDRLERSPLERRPNLLNRPEGDSDGRNLLTAVETPMCYEQISPNAIGAADCTRAVEF